MLRTILVLLFSFTICFSDLISSESDSLQKEQVGHVDYGNVDLGYVDYNFDITVLPKVSLLHTYPILRKINHNFSLNLLIGSADKLSGIEIGTLVNSNRKSSGWLQFAGLMNATEENFTGIQFSGLMNVTGGNYDGMQYSGLFNITGGSTYSFSIAGLTNISGGGSGLQISGLTNLTHSETYIQISGLVNKADELRSGLQISLFNISDVNKGIQLAGILNYTRIVENGLQIAPINLSEDFKGIPIGIFSYVKQVGLGFDFWADELGLINIGIRSGNREFYNTAFVGLLPDKNIKSTYGAMFGYHRDITESFSFNTDLSAQGFIRNYSKWDNKLNVISRLRFLAEYDIMKDISVFAGPTFNFYISSESPGEFDFPLIVHKNEHICDCGSTLWQRYWIGMQFGLKFGKTQNKTTKFQRLY